MIKKKLAAKILILILIAISIAPITTKAQESTDSTATATRTKGLKVGLFLGGSSFLGELGAETGPGSNSIKRNGQVHPVMSILAKYNFGNKNRFLSLIEMETSLSYTVLSGDDASSGNMYRQMRNLSFKSPLIEFSNQFQIGLPYRFSPYLTFGFSAFYFDPRAQYIDGSWHRLKPIGTEGQGVIPSREMYSNFSYAIPFGIGLKYLVSKKLELQLSYVYRRAFTDYVDDVSRTYVDSDQIIDSNGEIAAWLADPSYYPSPEASAPGEQRGDPTDNDAYYFYGFTVFYTIK